ncbi:endonuclease/exonuclease/phosphatase family protein [Colwellia sp. KU-HH00111]|uniref:endonuclease/exonuclease/phosphatase family protein n=1 Tax=Colwellia sp. KU-HH00111 TaxID=3127652 RepID=UPI003109235B
MKPYIKLIKPVLALVLYSTTILGSAISGIAMALDTPTKLRLATFNVSMEALNYVDRPSHGEAKVTGNELSQVLQQNNQQIKNIAEIIQRINPDVILLNEFDRVDNSHKNIQYFINHYLAKQQHGQASIEYPYFYQGAVNTGVKVTHNASNNHGFGYFEGHFGMALLSKYPIDEKQIRTFQRFKWRDMPGALKPINPETNQPWFSESVWQALRLSSKSHWDIPIKIKGETIHILASHPTPPVFDGPEDRNGKRNHDEIRFWVDYINGEQAHYIYDDLGQKGGLKPNQPFVIMGDQNASIINGDAIYNKGSQGIYALLHSDKIQDPLPKSLGGKHHDKKNINAQFHTAYWGMRADYILPSALGFTIKDAGVFWPKKNDDSYRLISSRQASSDHRLVWVDVELTK